MPKSDKGQPLLEGNDLSHTVSVRFCVHRDPCCCYICCPTCKCCQEQFENATQIVVPETTTVEEFLRTINRMFSPKTEYAVAYIHGYQLKNSDLIAPTIRSFEKFEAPIVIVPKDTCCSCLLV